MKTAWKVTVQVFYLCVVLYVFNQLRGRTEIIMAAMFGLTYVSVRSGQISQSIVFSQFGWALQQELDLIKISTNPHLVIDQDARRTIRDESDNVQKGLWIEYGALSIISLISLYCLFVTV